MEDVKQNFPEHLLPQLDKLMQRFRKIFQSSGALPQTSTTKHTIQLTSYRPFRQPPYRYLDAKKAIIKEQVEEMLAGGIIERCSSPYRSPIVIVQKKDGRPRFCVDYKTLNRITVDTIQTIPRINDALKEISTAKIFSTIDLKSGYWQVPMDISSKPLTAFTTPEGETFQFWVMPFGLKNAPSTFQHLMNQDILVNYTNKFCVVYLDDIIVYSSNWEEHLHHLSLVFERLAVHGLTCAIEKCHFGKTDVEYLGHNVADYGNRAQDEHVQVIMDLPPPKNKRELRKFLGTCNWLREYLPQFAMTTAALTNLLAGKGPFRWNNQAQRSFEEVKRQIQRPLHLSRPDPSLRYTLQTNASDIGAGAVLFQTDPEGERKIISYASAKFDDAQRRYDHYEKECYAITWAIRRYRPYLGQKPFTLKTNQHVLTWLHRLRNEKEKLSRWALLLEELTFTVEHCQTIKSNELPLALSQHPVGIAERIDGTERLLPPDNPQNPTPSYPEVFSVVTDNLASAIIGGHQQDPAISKIVLNLENYPEYTIIEGGLWRKIQNHWKLLVPEELKTRVLFEYHDSTLAGHPGGEETLRAIQDHYTWPHLRRDVREHVRQCRLCACTKATRPRHQDNLRPHQPRKPWETLAIDLTGPYPRSGRGKKYILVVTDLFSRWVEAFALGSSETPVILRTLDREVFSRWGYPKAILSDNGPQFTSKKWLNACDQWKTQLWTTPVYHPRANPTERRNQEIKKGLRLHLQDKKHKDWDLQLPKILFGLRSRRNAVTGSSPSQSLFGHNIKRPGEWAFPDLLESAPEQLKRIERVQRHQAEYQKRYSSSIPQSPRYQSGDPVYAKTHPLSNAAQGLHAGFIAPWEGPFFVQKHLGGDIYRINRDGKTVKYHGTMLKPAHGVPVEVRDVIGETSGSPNLTENPETGSHDIPVALNLMANLGQLSGQPNPTVAPSGPIMARPETQISEGRNESAPNLTATSTEPISHTRTISKQRQQTRERQSVDSAIEQPKQRQRTRERQSVDSAIEQPKQRQRARERQSVDSDIEQPKQRQRARERQSVDSDIEQPKQYQRTRKRRSVDNQRLPELRYNFRPRHKR